MDQDTPIRRSATCEKLPIRRERHAGNGEIGDLLPSNQRQRRTCYALCHILHPVSAACTGFLRIYSDCTSYRRRRMHLQGLPGNFSHSLKCGLNWSLGGGCGLLVKIIKISRPGSELGRFDGLAPIPVQTVQVYPSCPLTLDDSATLNFATLDYLVWNFPETAPIPAKFEGGAPISVQILLRTNLANLPYPRNALRGCSQGSFGEKGVVLGPFCWHFPPKVAKLFKN